MNNIANSIEIEKSDHIGVPKGFTAGRLLNQN